jgi:hypothetical protein
MGIFKPADPEVALRKAIDSERALRDQLRLQLTTAETMAGEHQKAVQKLLHDQADDVVIDKAEQKQITAEHRVANLSRTLSEADTKIADLESQLATVLDGKQRDEATKVIEQHAADLAAAGSDLDRALATMTNLAGRITPWCADAMGIHVFTGSAREELSAAVGMLQTILKAGSFPPERVLAKPAPPPAPLPKPEPTMQVCALKPIAWLAADNSIQVASRGEDIDLPPPLAKHALKIDAVCTMADPLRRTVKEGLGFKVGRPLYRNCVKLSDNMPPDDGEREPYSDRRVVAPVKFTPAPLPPGFEPHPNVAPPRQAMVARNDLELVARNNNSEDKKP